MSLVIFFILAIVFILFTKILILLLCNKHKSEEKFTTSNPSFCDFNGSYYSPSVIQTAGDKSNIGKFLRSMVSTALATNLPKVKDLTFQLYDCAQSNVNDIEVCGKYVVDISVGKIKIRSVKNLFDSLNFAELKQIQSFPADDSINPSAGMKQTIYAVLPVGFDADVYVDVLFDASILSDYKNTLIKVAGCLAIFIQLTVECPNKSSTVVTGISIDPNSGINKLTLDITNGDLNNLANVGSYVTKMDFAKMTQNGLNDVMKSTLFSHISDAIAGYLPYKLPLPACISVPSNTVTSSAGVKYTGLFGYRPTYPVPQNEDWQKCTVGCSMAGVGKAQQCLDACVDLVDSSSVSSTVECADKANLGFFQINDRAAVKDGVAPNGPLSPKVCTVIEPSDPTLIPDIQSGYQWYQTVDGYVPAIEGLLPALQVKSGVRGDLGQQISNSAVLDCRYACSQDPDCKAFSYVTLTDSSRGYNSGDCFKITGDNLVLDSNFNTYKVV